MATVGGVLSVTPRPANSSQLTLAPPVVATKYSGCWPSWPRERGGHVLVGLGAAGVGHRERPDRRAGGRALADLEGGTRRGGGRPHGDAGDVGEVHDVPAEPVTGLDTGHVGPTVGVGGGLRADPRRTGGVRARTTGLVEVLGLLVLGVQHRSVDTGQRAGCARTGVRVPRGDGPEDVRDRVAGVTGQHEAARCNRCTARSRASAGRGPGRAGRRPCCSRSVPSSASVTVTVYLMVSPNSKKPPLSGSCRSTVGAVLPATMIDVRRAGLAVGVGHRQLRGVVARRGVGERRGRRRSRRWCRRWSKSQA